MFENCHEIILKVTRDCNLRCAYCYVRDKDRFKNERMSFNVFKQIIDRYSEDQDKSKLQNKRKELHLVFHGGEPTLLDIHELVRFMNYAKRKIPSIRFGMQTNLTNITEELAVVMQTYGISPGISVDGWSSKSNSLRLGKEKNVILQNISLLKQYGVECSPLMVVNRVNIGEILQSIYRLMKHFSMSVIKANYVENIYVPEFADPEVTGEELVEKLFVPVINILHKKRMIIEANAEVILSRFFNALLFGVNNDKDKDNILTNCFVKFCSGGNNIVEVDSSGVVCFCGRWDDTHEICVLGSIKEKDLFGLSSYGKVFLLQQKKAAHIRIKHCDMCVAKDICNYGCIAFSYAKYKEILIRKDLVCDYFIKVNEYLINNLFTVLKDYAYIKKWSVHFINKNTYIVELPEKLPSLNPDTIKCLPNLEIITKQGRALLQVKKNV